MVALGMCLGPYGLKGDMKIRSYSGETEHFSQLAGQRIELRKDANVKAVNILTSSTYGKLGLVSFAGYESPESLHQLVGWELWADRKFGASLGPGEWYISDLVGCRLTYQGQDKAVVCNVWESTASDMLDVETPEGAHFHVPLQDKFIGSIDIQAKTIELLVDWILG